MAATRDECRVTAKPMFWWIGLMVLAGAAAALPASGAGGDKGGRVAIKKSDGQLDVAIDGKPFFSYHYDTQKPELRRPYIHPLHGPNGEVITQMGEVPGKRTAHYWHTGLWISHQKF